MDWKLGLGISLALIGVGVSLMGWAHPMAGIALSITGIVWLLLAVPKWGPLRKYWESKAKSGRFFSIQSSNDIAFGKPGEHGFAKSAKGESLILRLPVELRAIPHMLVESVELDVMGKRIPSNWEPAKVGTAWVQYIYFGIPNWVNPGRHKVRLVAFAGGKEWSSDEFSIPFPRP